MKENSIYDAKSLKTVIGKTADFSELAKDCVAFSNAQGGILDIGIEDGEKYPPSGQIIPEDLPTNIVNKISGLTHGVVVSTETRTSENNAEYIRLYIQRNPNAVAVTSSGKIFTRIGDNSVPVGSEDIARLAADKGCLSWEDTPTNFSWKNADEDKLNKIVHLLRESDRVSSFIKEKDTMSRCSPTANPFLL